RRDRRCPQASGPRASACHQHGTRARREPAIGVCPRRAAWQDRGRPVRPTADPRDKEQTVPGEHLTRQEAAERAALVAVESYDVELDLTRGARIFGSRTTITFTARDGASTFVDLLADAVHEIRLNGAHVDPH